MDYDNTSWQVYQINKSPKIKVLKVCLGLQYYWSPCSEQYLLTTAFTLSLTPGVPTPAVPVSGQCQQEVWLSSRLMYGYQDKLKSGRYGYQSRILFTKIVFKLTMGTLFLSSPMVNQSYTLM